MSLHHWAIRFYPFTQYSDFSSLCLNFTLHPTLFPRNQWFGQTSLKRNKFTGDNDFFINQFQANFHCCTPWKRQKTSDLKWGNLKWKRDQSQIRNNVFLFFIEPQYAQIVCSAEPVMQIRMRDFVIANVFNSVENDAEDDEEGRLWKGYKLVATFFWLPKNKIEQFFCFSNSDFLSNRLVSDYVNRSFKSDIFCKCYRGENTTIFYSLLWHYQSIFLFLFFATCLCIGLKSVVRIDIPNEKSVILSGLRFHLRFNYTAKNRSDLGKQPGGFWLSLM